MAEPATASVSSRPPTGERLGAGGEAEVFTVPGRPGMAHKHYRRPSPERTAKLRVMVAYPPAMADGAGRAVIAWPVELVTRAGEATGFLMPRVGEQSVPVFRIYNPQSRQQVAPAITWRYLLGVARNLATVVASVHEAGYVIGDLNESNLLVDRRGLVALVDCDSMQVRDPGTGEIHRCVVGRPEFTPREHQGVDFTRVDRTAASDAFALTVLVFQLLMQGVHPYAGVWQGSGDPPDLATRIRRRQSPYRWSAWPRLRRAVAAPPAAPPRRSLPPGVRRMVRRGLGRPSRRPTARQWVTALEQLELSLAACDRSPHHVHASRRCPWCAMVDAGRPDPFPGPPGSAAVAPRVPGLVERTRRQVGGALARTWRRTGPAATAGLAAAWPLAAVVAVAALGTIVPAVAVAMAAMSAGAVAARSAAGRGGSGEDRPPLRWSMLPRTAGAIGAVGNRARAAALGAAVALAVAGGIVGVAVLAAFAGLASAEGAVAIAASVTTAAGVLAPSAEIAGRPRARSARAAALVWVLALVAVVGAATVTTSWWPLPLGR